MNAYIRNWVIVLFINVVIFMIGWTCIVPDTVNDQTHLFGLIGSVEIMKGNTVTVFSVCALLSTFTLIVGMVEAVIEDFRPCRFNPATRAEKPRKAPKIEATRMRIEPTPEKVDDPSPKVDEDKDPKTPTMD